MIEDKRDKNSRDFYYPITDLQIITNFTVDYKENQEGICQYTMNLFLNIGEIKIKAIDFEGKKHTFPSSGYMAHNDEIRPRSQLHLSVRKALRERYPTQRILEEVTIPGLNLYLDFYLPLEKLAVECQGKQHSEYTPHFHQNSDGFKRSRQRDSLKKQWCTLNNIRLEEIRYDEDISGRIEAF